jgi:hypothetical protein
MERPSGFLVQLLLPLRDDCGGRFAPGDFERVRRELTERFGGVTFYARSPALGTWQDEGGGVERDEIVVVEVMAEREDRGWWRAYRAELERRFRQQEVVVRSLRCNRL